MDQRIYLEWLEKAVNQNNPLAMHAMGNWLREKGDDQEKAVSYYRAGAELGWKNSMVWLARLLKHGGKDLGQAAIWSAKGGSKLFLELLEEIRGALENAADCDFDRVCYALAGECTGMCMVADTGLNAATNKQPWQVAVSTNIAPVSNNSKNQSLPFFCVGIGRQEE
jgi:hypothetical protein